MPEPHVSCARAAEALRALTGVWAAAPATAELLAVLDSCTGKGCKGIPTAEAARWIAVVVESDTVYALTN